MTNNGKNSRQDSCTQNSYKNTSQIKILELNDKFRQTGVGGMTLMSRGISVLDPTIRQTIINAIRVFDQFTVDNDPYGTHDFGSVKVEGNLIFWKIDYYDLDLICGSPDPSDPNVTKRIMTIMLAEEY